MAVTGGTGFIGSRLLEQAPSGWKIAALTRRSMKPRRGVTWIEGALDDRQSLAALVKGANAVIHMAGTISGRTAQDFDIPNVEGTRTLLEAAQAAGVRRFVHVSSLAAREPSVSMYGGSKSRSEDVVRASTLNWVIVRPPAVYGPGDKETLELFRWAKRGIVMLPPAGRASIIHADDLSRLLLRLADGDAPSGIIFEPDDGSGGLAHPDLARALGKATGRSRTIPVSMPRSALKIGALLDQTIRREGAKLTRDRASYFCHPDWTSAPERAVPPELWQPTVKLADGLAATAEWYKANGWL
nr:NAD(P)-dependent oxidoreductase [Sphingomonas piscis]